MKNRTLKKLRKAKNASFVLSITETNVKNKALEYLADSLLKNKDLIVSANKKDINAGIKKGLSNALIDRLTLTEKRIDSFIEGLDIVKNLPDPIGEVIDSWTRPNGLKINKVRVPLGVIGIIYEARPNVTVDAASLCLKAGNAVVLRGGSDAINSNLAISHIMSKAVIKAGLPDGTIEFIDDTDRKSVKDLLSQRKYIDCIIPRGGAGLINMVVENSKIPVIETGVGNCHAYVESSADLEMANDIVLNAKLSRPSVCNAIETLLVDKNIAKQFLPNVLRKLEDAGVEIRGDKTTLDIYGRGKKATEDDWYCEYLDLILAVKVVENIDDAISHISKYSSHHSEVIITKDIKKAEKFTNEIDSAAVYVNASTRFTDGFEFGFGSEIGISTQKLHARGPMGLKEITSYKYIIGGSGQTRK